MILNSTNHNTFIFGLKTPFNINYEYYRFSKKFNLFREKSRDKSFYSRNITFESQYITFESRFSHILITFLPINHGNPISTNKKLKNISRSCFSDSNFNHDNVPDFVIPKKCHCAFF